MQNALDSVEKRFRAEKGAYDPEIWVRIDLSKNAISVTDNGIGMNDVQFRTALAPQVSFKEPPLRGSKGVGLTYLAYGFKAILLATGQF